MTAIILLVLIVILIADYIVTEREDKDEHRE